MALHPNSTLDIPEAPALMENQSENATKIAQFVQKKFKEYEKHRKSKEERWKRYYRMYRGRQWDTLRLKPNSRKTRAVVNYIFSAIETSVPLETDGNYKLSYHPRETKSQIPVTSQQDIQFIQQTTSTDKALADAMDQISDYQWRSLEMESKLPIASRIAKIYGTAFFYTFWNTALRDGLGDMDTKLCEPLYIYPDPLAKRVKDCCGLIYAMVVPVDEAKRLYPEKAMLIEPSKHIPAIYDHNIDIGDNQAPMKDENACMILEYWVKDGAKITVEEESEVPLDGVEKETAKQTIEKLKYPYGRIITVTDDVLLDDKPSQYPEFPFDPLYDYDIGEFFGIGEIEQLEQPQMLYNKIFSQLYDNLRLMGNPNIVADKTAGIDWSNYNNSTGQVIQKEQGTEVKMQDPPQFSPALPEFLKMLQFSMDTISGIHDITQGRQPVGITAAQAIELLQQSAQTRIRLKIRNLLQTIKGVGKKWFSLTKLYYNEPRILRITGPEGQSGWLALQGGDFKDADLDLDVDTDSSFIVSKQGRFEQGLTLLQNGAIQPMDLLMVTDWPDKEQIIQRMIQAQQAQMQAGQPQGGPTDDVQAKINQGVKMGMSDDEIRRQLVQAPQGVPQ